jgi:hypothetical protein
VRKLWIALALVACEGAKATEDAARDAAIDAPPIKPGDDTFYVPIGAACNAEPRILCDGGFGFCFDGVCRQQCSQFYPPCDAQHVDVRRTINGYAICVCVPL